jgi:hypothetical protein
MSNPDDAAKKASAQSSKLASAWGMQVALTHCEQCDWSYMIPQGSTIEVCPHCFQGPLASLDDLPDHLPHNLPPEMLVPFSAPPDLVDRGVQAFARRIPFAPYDLTPQKLRGRLQRIFLPMWLVDAEVVAPWQSEAGFDYQVVSHQSRYGDFGGWSEEQVKETRIRWEPRLGRLRRTYSNIPAPALEEHAAFERQLGAFDLAAAEAYQAQLASQAIVRLPNRSPEDAWPDAIPAIQLAAAEECRQAIGAEHLRDFRWTPEYGRHTWTQVLLPAFATYYHDEDGKPQAVLIHGQTGNVAGTRRSSPKRAKRASIIMLAIAAMLGAVGLGSFAFSGLGTGLASLTMLAVVAAAALGLMAIVPVAVSSSFNRREEQANKRL